MFPPLSIITGGGKWVEITVAADSLYQHLLLTAEKKFWRCVESGETPRSPRPRQSRRMPESRHVRDRPVKSRTEGVDKSILAIAEPHRYRNKEHLRFVAQQACLVCGRKPSDPHRLRFMQRRALGLNVSDEFVAPLCWIHHREVHRAGDERTWWKHAGSTRSGLLVTCGEKPDCMMAPVGLRIAPPGPDAAFGHHFDGASKQ
jgi:hypothetical protein